MYRRLGWRSLEHTEYKGFRVTIMQRDLTPNG